MYRYNWKNNIVIAVIALLSVVAVTNTASAQGYYDFKLSEMNSDVEMERDDLVSEKPLIVFVWSAECPHCKRQMPYVNALYKKLDLEEVNFVTVMMDKDERVASSYIEDKELAFPVLDYETGEIANYYRDNGWPTTYIFAKGGKFIEMVESTGTSYISDVMDAYEKAQDESN